MKTRIDHLVIGAGDLNQGTAFVKEFMGVDIPYGGVHVKMGTHNHVAQLGNNIFLEIIAINPDIEPPNGPRWFGLDDPLIRRRIEAHPTLLTWVVNTKSIDSLIRKTPFSFGKAEHISRGNLSWHFGIPDDGRLLAGGMLPYVIEWKTDLHPSVNMADIGCRFRDLHIYHPYPSWIQSVLESIGSTDLVIVHSLPQNSTPCLVAYIDTPLGVKELRSDSGLLRSP